MFDITGNVPIFVIGFALGALTGAFLYFLHDLWLRHERRRKRGW